ncbi:MAG: hypothetical protein WB786_08085 [Thermoplasmata archaeon]
MTWGNTTSYVFTAAIGQSFTIANPGTEFLDYLEPSWHYYYKIVAVSTCTDKSGTHWYHGTYASNWTTPVDGYGPTTISGQVLDKNYAGGIANMAVESMCAVPQGLPTYYVGTNQYGKYTINVPTALINGKNVPCPNGGGILVTVDNWAFIPPGGTGYSSVWTGHWNETMIVWAPQTINFYLATTFQSPTMVNYALFTNSADVNLEFCKVTSTSYSLTTSSSNTWGILGFSGSSSSSVLASGSFSNGVCSTTVGEPSNEYWGTYTTSGDVLVNNIAGRTVSNLWMQYFGDQSGGGIGSGGPLANPVSEPTTQAGACHAGGKIWGDPPVQIGPNSNEQISLGASGSISHLGSDTFGFNLAGGLAPLVLIPGIGEVASAILSTLTISATWGYAWSTTQTDQFNITANIVTGSHGGTFTAACQGSGSSSQGLAIEVWQDS